MRDIAATKQVGVSRLSREATIGTPIPRKPRVGLRWGQPKAAISAERGQRSHKRFMRTKRGNKAAPASALAIVAVCRRRMSHDVRMICMSADRADDAGAVVPDRLSGFQVFDLLRYVGHLTT